MIYNHASLLDLLICTTVSPHLNRGIKKSPLSHYLRRRLSSFHTSSLNVLYKKDESAAPDGEAGLEKCRYKKSNSPGCFFLVAVVVMSYYHE